MHVRGKRALVMLGGNMLRRVTTVGDADMKLETRQICTLHFFYQNAG